MNNFNPEDYDDDIIMVEMRSLGRGRGFEKTGEYSGLGDEVLMGRISKRLKRLLHVIDGGSLESAERVLLEDQVEELEDDNQALKDELDLSRRRIGELTKANEDTAGHDELLSQINEVLSDTQVENYLDLESAVEALIEEYEDLREETEDED